MNPLQLLKSLSIKLNLKFETQDWGIINADAERFNEFILFFKNNQDLHSTQRYQLCELIIASFNEAMIKDKLSKEEFEKFIKFVSENNNTFGGLFAYWSSLDRTNEFPVVEVLNNLTKEE